MSVVSFLHTADLHLGSPLKAVGVLSAELQETLREAAYAAVRRVVDAALRHEVDFVLISGDVYDTDSRSVKANKFFIVQMNRLREAGIPVYVIYGNHDPLGSAREWFRLPENVHLFGSEDVEIAEVRNSKGVAVARVLGQSYRNASESRKLYHAYTPPDNDLFNVGLLHTGLNPRANSCVPCSLEDLKARNLDYWALGHVHNPRVLNREWPVVVYPGIPQGRDQGETGVGGCFLVTVRTGRETRMHFVPTASVVWLNCLVEAGDGVESIDDLEELLLAKGQELLAGSPRLPAGVELPAGEKVPLDGYVVRWEVTGRSKIHRELVANQEEVAEALTTAMRSRLARGRPFLWTETVKLETSSRLPAQDELPENDVVLRGFFEARRELENDPKLRKLAEKEMGQIWYRQKDHEDIQSMSFALTEEVFQRILQRACLRAVEQVLEGREDR